MLQRFRPRLLDCLPGYRAADLAADAGAGITVGLVALPLAMAFAIGSGVKPEAGIFTAIIAGFIIAVLGGSRVQIGGPAGAFIVIVYGIIQQYGLANLLLGGLVGRWNGALPQLLISYSFGPLVPQLLLCCAVAVLALGLRRVLLLES